MENCPICSSDDFEIYVDHLKDGYYVDCKVCGRYEISRTACSVVGSYDKEKKALLSAAIKQNGSQDKRISVFTNTIEKLIETIKRPLDPLEAGDKVLLNLVKGLKAFGEVIVVNCEHDYPLYSLFDAGELFTVLYSMQAAGLITFSNNGNKAGITLTSAGWMRVKDLKKSIRDIKSKKAFVAMCFKDELDSIYFDGIRPALVEVGFEPIRMKELQHNDKIDDRIISEILQSGLLIADFTEHRGGVYFEAGFAKGKGIHVIWTCKKSDLSNAHFDTRQYNHVEWETADELRVKLVDRINATVQASVLPVSE